MKRIIKFIPVLLLMPLLLASCAGEKIRTKQESGKAGVVRFSLTSSLRAMGDENIIHPTPALDREKVWKNSMLWSTVLPPVCTIKR